MILKILVPLLTVLISVPALAQISIEREGEIPPPEIQVDEKEVLPQIRELVSSWGYEIVGCGNDMASIQVDNSFVCVRPTTKLPPGDYTYNRIEKKIVPREIPTAQYTFKSVLQYSNCIEDILQFYQDKSAFDLKPRQSDCRKDVFTEYKDKGIDRDRAIALIRDADFYATALLSTKLYPPKGQRMRVAHMLGYVYTIDR